MFIEVSLTLQKNFLLIYKSFEGLHFKASERHCWVSTVAEDLHIDREMKCKYKLLSIITLWWIIEQNQIAQHWFTHGQLIPCSQIQRLMGLFDLIVHKKIPLVLLLSAINKWSESKPPPGLWKVFVAGANHCLYTCLSVGRWKPLTDIRSILNWISWPLFLDKQQINLTGLAGKSAGVILKCLRLVFYLPVEVHPCKRSVSHQYKYRCCILLWTLECVYIHMIKQLIIWLYT